MSTAVRSTKPRSKAVQYDLILADYILPDLDGLQALEIAAANVADTPFLFVTSKLTDDRAAEALRQGATDFIVKDRFAGSYLRSNARRRGPCTA